jgi:lipopolysaccharide export LptBFGC system permease protein LptF
MMLAKTYFIKEYIKSLLMTFGFAISLIFILDLAEVIKNHIVDIILITSYKTSKNIIHLMPLVILVGTTITFINLVKRNELVIFITLGLPKSFFLIIISAIISLVFLFIILVVIPINTQLSLSIDTINKKISFEETGILFKGVDNSFIKAKRMDMDNLYQITIWKLDNQFNLEYIIRADSGVIEKGQLYISQPITYKKSSKIYNDNLSIKVDITPTEIIKNVLEPDQVSIFDMPYFINVIKKLGFSIIQHERYFWDKITFFINYITMGLISFIGAYQVINRLVKKERIFYSIVAGLGLFFIQDIIITMLPYSIGISVVLTKIILFIIVVLYLIRTRNYI